jgi:signal transduction histidine kinase
MTTRIIWKFLGALIALIVLSDTVIFLSLSRRLGTFFEDRLVQSTKDHAAIMKELLCDPILLKQHDSLTQDVLRFASLLNLRITVITPDGQVLVDSESDHDTMDNHAAREEVAQALATGTGESYRLSDTVGIRMKYLAVRLDKDDQIVAVVRFALPNAQIKEELHAIYLIVLAASLVAILIALPAAYAVSKGFTFHITDLRQAAECMAKGDFKTRVNIRRNDELGQLADSLNTMAAELEQRWQAQKQLAQTKTDFVANVSHELKTPLTLIKGYIETLQDKGMQDTEKARRFIAIINDHANRLDHLIDDLLRLSELESTRDAIETSPTDLQKMVDDVALGFGYALTQKDLTLTIQAEGTDFTASVNPDKMEQVFVNLIDNAVKYTPEKGQITIHLKALDDRIRLAFEDNGIGIGPDHVDHIFERFYRVDKARSRKLGGTGLGLGIAKHIVLAHRGTIQVQSQPGQGTTFTVTLPRRRE